MEYNKKLFTKANDKKVLHKVKKQWVVLSMALLAAFGAKALATHAVNADVTTPAAGKTTSQASSSKSASDAHLVNSQSNVNANNQNNNRAQANQISQGRQNTPVNVKSSNQIMQAANHIHQHMLNNATHNLGSAKPALGADEPALKSSQPNATLQKSNKQQGVQAVNNNKLKSNLGAINPEATSSVNFEFLNQSHNKVGSDTYTGQAGSTVSLYQIFNNPKFNIPSDYQLNPTTYTVKNDKGFKVTLPSANQTVDAKFPIYLLGNLRPNYPDDVFPINIVEYMADGSHTTQQIAYQPHNRIGDTSVTINPYDLVNPKYPYVSDYAKYFPNGNYEDFYQYSKDQPVTIKLDANGRPTTSTDNIKFIYISNEAPSGVMNMSSIHARYYDKSDINPNQTYNENSDQNISGENNPVKGTSVDDHNMIGELYDYRGRRQNIPSSDYYYVKDLTKAPTKFTSDSPYFNIEVARKTRINYWLISDGKKTMLKGPSPQMPELVAPNPIKNASDGYYYEPLYKGIYNVPGFTETIEHNYKDDKGNTQSLANNDIKVSDLNKNFTPSDGQTYNVDLTKNKYSITIEYVKYPKVHPDVRVDKIPKSDIVTVGSTVTKPYGSSVNIDNADKLQIYNLKTNNGVNWVIPSQFSYLDNPTYYFNKPYNQTLTVPVELPNAKVTTNFTYKYPKELGGKTVATKKSNPEPDNSPINYNDWTNPDYIPASDQFTQNPVPQSDTSTYQDGANNVIYVEPKKITAKIIYKNSDGQQVGNTYQVPGNISDTTPISYSDYEQPDKLPQGYTNPTVNIGQDASKDVQYKGVNVIHVIRKGTIDIKYYSDNVPMNSDTTKEFYGHNKEPFGKTSDQNPLKYIPSGYSFNNYIDRDDPRNITEFDNGNQTIKVNLVKNVTGHIYYYDVNSGTDLYHLSDVTGKPGTKINNEYAKYANPKVLAKDLPGYNFAQPNYATLNPNWNLESDSEYRIPVETNQGTIYIKYFINGNKEPIGTQSSIQDVNYHYYPYDDINYYMSHKLPAAYKGYVVQSVTLGNSKAPKEMKYTRAPQTVDVDLVTPNTPTPKTGSALIEYQDISDPDENIVSSTDVNSGPYGTPIPSDDYVTPNGYVDPVRDPKNHNVLDNTTDIVWVKKFKPQSTPTSYAPAPSSASSMPSAPASSASPAPSQSSAAPSSSVTPPSSKSVAPQRKSTVLAHHARRGNIGVTYEEPNGKVITKRNYRGKVGESFTPNTTPKPGYRYEIVSGNGVDQFQKRGQHVVMRLVKIASMNRRNNHVDTRNSRPVTTIPSSKRIKGSAFDQALNKEATLARRRQSGKLPQTGESQSNYVEVIGAALLMISAVFVAGYDFDMKRRRD